MKQIKVPTRAEVSPENAAIFDNLEKMLGKVPNLYATFGWSKNGLGNYLALQNAKTSITPKEREAVNLVVSQVNDCAYCLAAHTAISGMMKWYDAAQIMELRAGHASWDAKLNALATFVRETAKHRGRPSGAAKEAFFAAGYTEENLIDVLIAIGDKVISNYLHAVTDIPVDWPAAAPLEEVAVV